MANVADKPQPPTDDEKKNGKVPSPWSVLWPAYLCSFVDFLGFGVAIPILPFFTMELGWITNDPKCLLILKKNEKISRNDRCESTGKKFKNCCGAL